MAAPFISTVDVPRFTALYPTSVSANGRYILDQYGAPWLMIGDTSQALVANASVSDMTTYFLDRAAKGMNCVSVHLIADAHPGSTRADGSTFDGLTPFAGGLTDLTHPNANYWARVDTMFTLAFQQGITVFANPAETSGMLANLKTAGSANCSTYGQFIGNRYKGFPNVVWLFGNDWGTDTVLTYSTDTTGRTCVAAMVDGIRTAGDTHLRTAELNYYQSTTTDLIAVDSTWSNRIDLNLVYNYYPTYSECQTAWSNSTKTMPLFFGEGSYELTQTAGWTTADPVPTNTMRRSFWWTITSGGVGSLWGTRSVQNWASNDNGIAPLNSLNTTGTQEYLYYRQFWLNRQWWGLTPDLNGANGLTTSASRGAFQGGQATPKSSNYVTSAVTADGSLGVAYLPAATTVTVDMTKMRGSTRATWFDPTTGAYTGIGVFANSGTHVFDSTGLAAHAADPVDAVAYTDYILLLEA